MSRNLAITFDIITVDEEADSLYYTDREDANDNSTYNNIGDDLVQLTADGILGHHGLLVQLLVVVVLFSDQERR